MINKKCSMVIAILSMLTFSESTMALGDDIFISDRQLEYVRDNLASDPWQSAYQRAVKDNLAKKKL